MSKERVLWFVFYLILLMGVYYLWYEVDTILASKRSVGPSIPPKETFDQKIERLIDLRLMEEEQKASLVVKDERKAKS